MLTKKKLTVKKVKKNNPHYSTLYFKESFEGEPGQFTMIQIPGKGEKPMSLSSRNSITVERKGSFTRALSKLNEGDRVYLKEPLGQGFEEKNHLAIAGGCGIAPITYLIEEDRVEKLLYGAKSKEYLIQDKFQDRDVEYATDDGSHGHKGFVTDLITRELVNKFKNFAICGPEIMIKNTARKLVKKGVESFKIYLSLERYMKCGVGLCGNCECSGRRVCVDGPVFTYDEMKKMDDFGEKERVKSGKKVPLEE